jgi:hypothetical protein
LKLEVWRRRDERWRRRLHRLRTSRAQISLANTVTDTLKPTRLQAIEAAVAVEEVLSAHVDGAVAVAEHDTAPPAKEQSAYEDEE